jgi:energy-coupling factor transporter ATP-binding protein EcfA2
MSETVQSLREQLAEAEGNLRLIRERKAEYVEPHKIDLDLIKAERHWEAQIADLKRRLVWLTEFPCPYRGLEPFEAEHAEFYFGREEMVERLTAKAGQASFVAVVGPSGCGKSSLVRAGLVTALREGALAGSQDWATRIFRPGRNPLRALAAPLVALLEPEASEVDRLAEVRKLADHLRDGVLLMDDVTARLREVNPDFPHLLLVADQFEELYTECDDETLRRVFVKALLAAAETEWVTVLLTLRADFYGRVLEDRALGEWVDVGLFNVLPMSEAERWAAIERPALAVGQVFEPGLVERILNDVTDAPGSLPLLEFALTELWVRQTAAGLLTHEAYEAIGEVQGAVARRAEVVYRGLEEQGQGEIVRHIFLRLTHYGEGVKGTRRQATLDNLVTPRTPRVAVEAVGRALADARLLVIGRDEATDMVTIEVAHESLIQGWERLRRWLDDNWVFGLWRERLATARQTWDEMEWDEGALLRGAPLVESEGWLTERGDDLNVDERRYIQRSVALREREQAARRRDRVLFNVAGGLLGGVLGGFIGGMISYFCEIGSEGMVGVGLSSGLFGAGFGGGIAFGISFGGVFGGQRKIFPVIGGAVAGMLLGALLGPSFGVELGPEKIGLFVFLGIFLGAVYGGGIALSIAVGKRFGKRKRIPVWSLMGALVGGLVGMPFSIVFSAFVGLGITVGIGILDDRFQTKAT